VDLNVIVPPVPPTILYKGKPVIGNKIHVKENQSITLVCESTGGVPQPSLNWWKDAKLIDNSYIRK